MFQYKRLGHNIPCPWKSRNSLLPRESQGFCICFSCSFLLSTSTCHEPGCSCSFSRLMGQKSLLVWTVIAWSNKKRLSVHKPCLTGKTYSSDVAFLAESSWLWSSLPGLIRHRLTGQIKVQDTPVQDKAFVQYSQQKVVLLNTEPHITTHPGWKLELAQESCILPEFCFTCRYKSKDRVRAWKTCLPTTSERGEEWVGWVGLSNRSQ